VIGLGLGIGDIFHFPMMSWLIDWWQVVTD